MDAALIDNEHVDTRTRGEVTGLMRKLDIEKAYNHVNWGYLLSILKQMGFRGKWLKWISVFLIKVVWFSILLNGKHVGFFSI